MVHKIVSPSNEAVKMGKAFAIGIEIGLRWGHLFSGIDKTLRPAKASIKIKPDSMDMLKQDYEHFCEWGYFPEGLVH